jgi:hypothetical protein
MNFISKTILLSLCLFLFVVVAKAQTTTSGHASKISKSEINIRENEKGVKSLSEEEKQNILKSRGYSVWQVENDGMIQFTKIVSRPLTQEDINLSKKNWGTNAEGDFRFLPKDIGKKMGFPKQGILNASNLDEIIPPIYDELDDRFQNGKILAFDGKKYFVINKKGEIIYTDTEKLKDYTLIQITGPFSVLEEQLRVVKNKLGKYGFINEKFDSVIPCLYDNVSSSSKAGIWFSVGFCIAKLNNKIGFINKLGVFRAINAEMIGFGSNTFNSEGIATYTLNKKMGVIDTNGVIIIQAKYDEVDLRGSNYTVKNGLKYGVIDNKGKIIVPIAYSGIINVGTLEQIQVKVGGDYRYYKELELIAQQSTEKSNQTRSSLIEGSGYVAKTTINSNQSLEYDFSELKSQGCDVIKSEFKQFAIKFISYKKRVKSNPSSLSFREDTDWENNLRKFSDLATDCAIKLKGDYALQVLGYMEKVSALLPIDPIIPSSSRNNSSVQNKSTSNTSQSKPTQASNTAVKKVDQSAGFENAQSSTLIGKCRFTGPQPGKGVSLLIGSDVQLYHNGSFKVTTIGGGVDYYTGNGDIWIIYKNPKARTKYNFKTSNGKVQTCDGY